MELLIVIGVLIWLSLKVTKNRGYTTEGWKIACWIASPLALLAVAFLPNKRKEAIEERRHQELLAAARGEPPPPEVPPAPPAADTSNAWLAPGQRVALKPPRSIWHASRRNRDGSTRIHPEHESW